MIVKNLDIMGTNRKASPAPSLIRLRSNLPTTGRRSVKSESSTRFINFSTKIKGKARFSALPFDDIKNFVLGPKYNLSLNFITPAESKKLNLKYRQKNCSTNILSFPLTTNDGELYIDLITSKLEAKKFDRPFENFVIFLFIHGLYHLKGLDHGAKMDKAEKLCRKKFAI